MNEKEMIKYLKEQHPFNLTDLDAKKRIKLGFNEYTNYAELKETMLSQGFEEDEIPTEKGIDEKKYPDSYVRLANGHILEEFS